MYDRDIVREYVIDWCNDRALKGHIVFNIEDCGQTRVRFRTENMNTVFPSVRNVMVSQEKKWSENCYFYEIVLLNNGVRIKLALNNVEQNPVLNRMKLLFEFNKRYPEKEDWIWYICWGMKIVHFDDIKGKKELFEVLDFQYSLIMKSEKDFLKYIANKKEH